MKTLQDQLNTIKSFNNAVITEVVTMSYGTIVKFESTLFALDGIKNALGIKINSNQYSNESMFVTTLPNV